MKNIILNLALSFGAHLIICLLVVASLSKWLIPAIPAAVPYVIVFDVCFCLGMLSIWYAINFDIDSWHIGAYIVIVAILVLAFFLSLLDWLLGIDLIPTPWRYVAVFETLPLAMLFVIFLVIIAAESTFWPMGNRYYGKRQPA